MTAIAVYEYAAVAAQCEMAAKKNFDPFEGNMEKPALKRRCLQRLLSLLAMTLLMGTAPANAEYPSVPKALLSAVTSGTDYILYREGLLSVSLTHAEIGDVLQEISRQSGVVIRSAGRLTGQITIRFDNLPLESGLKKMLKNKNHSFIYRKSHQGGKPIYTLCQVNLLGIAGSDSKFRETKAAPPLLGKPASEFAGIPPELKDLEPLIQAFLDHNPNMSDEYLRLISEAITEQLPEVQRQLLDAIEAAGEEGKAGLPALENLTGGLDHLRGLGELKDRLEAAFKHNWTTSDKLQNLPPGMILQQLSEMREQMLRAKEASGEEAAPGAETTEAFSSEQESAEERHGGSRTSKPRTTNALR